MTVNAYVNFKLFEQGLPERKSTIKAIAAQILALLGASGIGPAIRSMAQAVEQGALPLDPETQASIRAACADIAVIKSLLMKALGIKER
ncbi:hypothetical protein [Maricaulis alexandrii]|uniref:hypothetical protein n=1 Tax=Maricaulis alexandrii TaxID=2570354 RepID=UPI001109929A|nr:hypothetical protein [Maricaulis alexandrii]